MDSKIRSSLLHAGHLPQASGPQTTPTPTATHFRPAVVVPTEPRAPNSELRPDQALSETARQATTTDSKAPSADAPSSLSARRASMRNPGLMNDKRYLDFRRKERFGYTEMEAAARGLARKLASASPGVPELRKLLQELEAFHNKYLNSASLAAAPIAGEVLRQFESERGRLQDFARGHIALKDEHRAELTNLFRAVATVLESIEHAASAEISESKLEAKFQESQLANHRDLLCKILSDPRRHSELGRLHAHCVSEHSLENLSFLLEVKAAMRAPVLSRATAYRAIIDKYIRPGASEEINLPDPIRNAVLEPAGTSRSSSSSSSPEITAALQAALTPLDQAMARAETEIYRLMATDTIPRFLASPPPQPQRPAS